MNNAIILQHVYNPSEYSHLVEITFQRHWRYCQYHKFDYLLDTAKETDGDCGDWDKVRMITRALGRGYEYVIWIDADAMIYDVRVDLRQACGAPISGVVFDNPAEHVNTGVLYFHNGKNTPRMVDDWRNGAPGDPDAGYMAGEQGVFNLLCMDWQKDERIKYLDNTWNSVDFISPSQFPVVMAWHGYHDIGIRAERMKAAIAAYNKPNPVV